MNTLEKEVDLTTSKQINKKIGVILVNLGTPEKCEIKEIRSYLKEFLSDPRVIDIPAPARFMLLNAVILPFRPKAIKPQYEKIWLDEGSPLLVHGENVANLIKERISDKYDIEFCMRYGKPYLNEAIEKFKKPIYEKIKIIPLFPQYSSSVTGSVVQKVMELVKGWETIPSIEFVNYFYDNKKLIDAFVKIGQKYDPKSYDHVLYSFHSIPERHIKKSDCTNTCLKTKDCCEKLVNKYCYKGQCIQMAKMISDELGLKDDDYSVSFQSRLGRTPWIKPYTDKHLKKLAKKGNKKVLVYCPSFVSDCLETSFEVGVEYKELFKSFEGEELQLVEGLNSSIEWVDALEDIIINS